MADCKHCGAFFEGVALGGHVVHCLKNPKRYVVPKGTKRGPPSEETKRKIALGRSKYLMENPDQVPYRLYHASGKSWPEKKFEALLVRKGVTGWIYNMHAGMYTYDFAFVDLKIDVEIDGATHEQEKVQRLDARRDAWTIEQGWRVFRIPAKTLMREEEKVFEELIKFIGDDRIFGKLDVPKKLPKMTVSAEVARKRKENSIKINNVWSAKINQHDVDFSKMSWPQEVAGLLSISMVYAVRWVKKWMPDCYEIALSAGYGRKRMQKSDVQDLLLKVQQGGIDFSKVGWRKEVANVLKIKDSSAARWLKANLPEQYAGARKVARITKN